MNGEILARLTQVTDEEQRLLTGGDIDRSLYMEEQTDIINSKKLLASGKLITVRPHTRFVHFPAHTHDYIEMVYMVSGQTTHIVDGKTVTLRAGELLLLSQNARQEILPADREDIAVNFIILPQFFDNVLAMLGNEETPLRRFLVDCLKTGDHALSYLHFAVSDLLPVQNLVENLIWTLLYGAPNKRSINQITMGLLFLQLINHTDRLQYPSKQDGVTLLILRYIEEHYADGALTTLCDETHYDIAWLSREIKRKTGKTYTQLLQDKRLSQASFLLVNTDLSVSDIAHRVGYENESYFHRIFFEKYGATPRNYRQHYTRQS